ncbi:protein TIFY 5A-like [Rutidosis leptorrhynchoides]|uniref:protein TIFY 5A-like n=1 Tax=Rutidosis leptorrhynchoides TaxID=125765 RepID=UPI003A9A14E9
MRRNCNLELRLVPPSPYTFSDDHHRLINATEEINGEAKEKQNQQLTIFYEGKDSVCDVTELQARSIIKLASEEMEDKWRKTPRSIASSQPLSPLMPSPSSSLSPSPSPSPSGLSMKRSLQRFLQKRKHRMQATSPYHP